MTQKHPKAPERGTIAVQEADYKRNVEKGDTIAATLALIRLNRAKSGETYHITDRLEPGEWGEAVRKAERDILAKKQWDQLTRMSGS